MKNLQWRLLNWNPRVRDIFVESLLDLAKADSRVILITADLGFGLFDEFRNQLPSQFLNVGVAEQNMIGVASGLALEGFIPYCYSIANFSFMRCLEQIRNDVCYHDLSVNIVSNGAGFSYGPLGMSHHATEDISIMRALPNIEVLVPATLENAAEIAKYSSTNGKPNYIRLDKSFINNKLKVDEYEPWQLVREGSGICILAIGGITEEAISAADYLAEKSGKLVRVISVVRMINLDKQQLLKYLGDINLIITIEENVKSGGFGSYILEQLAENEINIQVKIHAIEDKYESVVGDQKYLRALNKLTSMDLLETIKHTKRDW